MAVSAARPTRVADLKQGQYSDGHPLDEVQYLECKLILKPDRFTTAKVFFEYGELVAQTAKKFGIDFINKGIVLRPRIREVLFLDTADFRLYNNAFILRRVYGTKTAFPRVTPKSFLSSATRTCSGPRNSTCGRTSPAITESSSRRRPCR